MELVAFGALLARDEGAPFAATTLDRLDAGAGFLRALQAGEGHVPGIGDDDEGRVLLAPHVDEPFYVASVANSIAGLTGRDDASAARPGYLREALFAAPSEKALPRKDFQRTFSDGGYAVLQECIAGRKVHLTFDAGPLGYLSLAAHGHADALAIWLSIDGEPVLVDAGTWLYHSGEATRAALRRSQAHNTLTLENHSQSEPSAAFSWANKAKARFCEPDPQLYDSQTVFKIAGTPRWLRQESRRHAQARHHWPCRRVHDRRPARRRNASPRRVDTVPVSSFRGPCTGRRLRNICPQTCRGRCVNAAHRAKRLHDQCIRRH